MRPVPLTLAWVALLASAASMAQDVPPAGRSLRASARFLDTTVGLWEMLEQPQPARQPTLAEVAGADRPNAAADFGLSFNCAVTRNGALTDCRPIYVSDDGVDGAALTRFLARRFRLSAASARLAREKAYRLTVDVALDTVDRHGMPKECRPPFCMIEGAVPPPPPPIGQDPVIAAALGRARACFDAAWQRSSRLRSAAERSLRERAGRPASDQDRAEVLDYVNSRRALAACESGLEKTASLLPLGAGDRKAVATAVAAMKASHAGQARYERIVLIGLLDPAVATAEADLR